MAPKKRPAAAMAVPAARKSKVRTTSGAAEDALVLDAVSAVSETALEMQEAMPAETNAAKAKAPPPRRLLVYVDRAGATEAPQPEAMPVPEEERTPSVEAETLILGGLSPSSPQGESDGHSHSQSHGQSMALPAQDIQQAVLEESLSTTGLIPADVSTVSESSVPLDAGDGNKFPEAVEAIKNEVPETELMAPSASTRHQDYTSCTLASEHEILVKQADASNSNEAAGLQREPLTEAHVDAATSNGKDRLNGSFLWKTAKGQTANYG